MIDRARRLIEEPAYTPRAAARHLLLPVSTLRWWTLGNGVHPPIIRIASPQEQFLSFRDLTEVHVLSAIMNPDHGRVPIAVVRSVVEMLCERFGSEHPLSDRRMCGEGKDFFAARYGSLVNASRHGQAAIAATLGSYLDRIKRDAEGDPVRLLIVTRAKPEGPQHVMIEPGVQGGQPCITGTEITTALVADRFKRGESIADLATRFRRPPVEIEEAVRYEAECR